MLVNMNNETVKTVIVYENEADSFRKAIKLNRKNAIIEPLMYSEIGNELVVMVGVKFNIAQYPLLDFQFSMFYHIPAFIYKDGTFSIYEKKAELQHSCIYVWEKDKYLTTNRTITLLSRVTKEKTPCHTLLSITTLKKFIDFFSVLNNQNRVKPLKDFLKWYVDHREREEEKKIVNA